MRGARSNSVAEAGYRDEVSLPVIVNDKAHSGESWLEVVSGQFARVAVRVAIQMTHVSTQARTAEGFRTLRRHRAAASDNAFISRGYRLLETPIGPKSYRRLDVRRMK